MDWEVAARTAKRLSPPPPSVSRTEADAAVGELLDTLAECDLDRNTWVVFITDHGPALPRAKSTLYAPGTGIALIIRPPTGRQLPPKVYADLFSGVDLLPTLLDSLGLDVPADVEGVTHAAQLTTPSPSTDSARGELFTSKTYHDSFDPIRAVRTKDYSYIENYAHRPMLDLPWDIADSPSGRAVSPYVQADRPSRELYDLRGDPGETVNLLDADGYEEVAEDLALRLHSWRESTGDVIPSEFVGTRISHRYTEDYIKIHGLTLTSRSAHSDERGIDDDVTR